MIRHKERSATSKQNHRAVAVVGSDLVVHSPSPRVVDPTGLLENVAPVDPLAIRTARVLGYRRGEGQTIAYVPKLERLIVHKYTVVGVDPRGDSLSVKPAIIGLARFTLKRRDARTDIGRHIGLARPGIDRMVERMIEIDQRMDVLRFHIRQNQRRPRVVLKKTRSIERTPLHAPRWQRPKHRMVIVKR